MKHTEGSGDETITGVYDVEDEQGLRDDHHGGWNQALKRALANVPDSWKGSTVSVKYRAHITENPGEIDQYIVDLTP